MDEPKDPFDEPSILRDEGEAVDCIISVKTYDGGEGRAIDTSLLADILKSHGVVLREGGEDYADVVHTEGLGIYWCQTDKLHITVSCSVAVLPALVAKVAGSALVTSTEDRSSMMFWVRGYGPSGDLVAESEQSKKIRDFFTDVISDSIGHGVPEVKPRHLKIVE